MDYKLAVGQKVCTTRAVRGWFDHSMSRAIPIDTLGTVVGRGYDKVDRKTLYLVDWGDEYKQNFLPEDALRLA
jgi:hypothetical protein